MSQERTATSAARSVGSGAARVLRAWRVLPYERRLAAGAALGLFVTLFLPWYQETVIAPDRATRLQSASASVTGWGAFSFVEAAVLLVAVGVLTLLIQRAEGRAFHLPGGDGWVIMLAGGWTCGLVIWRIFDKQGTSSHGPYATTSGIEWGIFVALGVAGFLAYAGSRIRAAHQPEPPLPGDAGARRGDAEARAGNAEARAGNAETRAGNAETREGDVVLSPPARIPRAEPAPAEGPAPAPATPPRPVPAKPPRPVPARPEEFGSASDRRTGWLTARPEGWTANPDTARRAPTRSWSYADDNVQQPPHDDPPAAPERELEAPDVPEPRTTRITRRRKRPPDDQLTIKLDRDHDASNGERHP